MNTATRTLPDPQPSLETAPVWAAAAEGRLLVGKCNECGRFHHYPRRQCPFCLRTASWVDAAGGGSIYTFSHMRQASVPYVIAMVRLDEGVSLMTNIVDCDPDALRIGDRVRLCFRQTEGGLALPMFTPDGAH